MNLIQILLVESSIGKCDWQCFYLICCVHLRQEQRLGCLLSLVFFEFFSCVKPSLSAGGLIFDWAAAARAEQTQWAGWRGWEMRCAASSKWIWRTWLLCNKGTLWDIFYLLVGRRELCSWDIFLRTAMHNHHVWIVSKCCSGAALNQGGCHSTSHCECTSWSTPAQAEPSASGDSSDPHEERRKTFSPAPGCAFLGVSPTIAPKSLPGELRGSKSHPLCASALRHERGQGWAVTSGWSNSPWMSSFSQQLMLLAPASGPELL